MKSRYILFVAVLFAAVLRAEDKTVFVAPGSKVEVRVLPEHRVAAVDQIVDATEAKNVVRALEILLRYAPEKYETYISGITSGGSVSTLTGWTYNTARKTKADELRTEAESIENQAARKRQKAAELDKEQEEIEWARGILAKWKAKLKTLE